MIEFKLATYEDSSYDMCCNTTHVILNIHGIKIPLCSYCIKDLKQSLDTLLEQYNIDD